MPFPLKFRAKKPGKNQNSQSWMNETLPFSLVHQVVTPDDEEASPGSLQRKKPVKNPSSQSWMNETLPFSLIHQVVTPDDDEDLTKGNPAALVKEPQRLSLSAQSEPLVSAAPHGLTWQGREVCLELKEYAARVQRGEPLPPYSGSILLEPALPARSSAPSMPAVDRSLGKFAIFALALLAVGAASLVSEEQLRSTEQSLTRFSERVSKLF